MIRLALLALETLNVSEIYAARGDEWRAHEYHERAVFYLRVAVAMKEQS